MENNPFLILIVLDPPSVYDHTAHFGVLQKLLRPYQFDFMFLRSLPEKLDTIGREKKSLKKV